MQGPDIEGYLKKFNFSLAEASSARGVPESGETKRYDLTVSGVEFALTNDILANDFDGKIESFADELVRLELLKAADVERFVALAGKTPCT